MALIKATRAQDCANPARELERDCSSLIQNLSNPSAVTRRWAARDLAQCSDSSAALVAHLATEQDASVREVILTTLTHIGDATAVTGLVQCLRSEDASLRNEAIEAMKQLPDAVAPIMHDLLHDADADVRIFSVNILESLRHPDVERWLCEVILSDTHVNVCATAVDLLGEVGEKDALEPLRQLKARFAGETYIEFAADLAIKRILEA